MYVHGQPVKAAYEVAGMAVTGGADSGGQRPGLGGRGCRCADARVLLRAEYSRPGTRPGKCLPAYDAMRRPSREYRERTLFREVWSWL